MNGSFLSDMNISKTVFDKDVEGLFANLVLSLALWDNLVYGSSNIEISENLCLKKTDLGAVSKLHM